MATAFLKLENTETIVTVSDAAKWLHNKIKQSETEPFAEKVLVTPELARAILSNNPGNRKIRKSLVNKIADDIENARWQFNGETVIIAKSGELNDGQHRLNAVLAAQIAVPMLLAFGVNRGTRFTVDAGAMRNAKDQLDLKGFKYPTQLSGISRMVIAYEETGKETLGRTNDVSIQAVMERANNDRGIIDAANWAGSHARKMNRIIPATISGFCYYVFMKVNKTKAKEFMEGLRDGLNLSNKSPIYVARERLMISKLTNVEKVETLFRAFNLYLKGFDSGRILLTKKLPKLGS